MKKLMRNFTKKKTNCIKVVSNAEDDIIDFIIALIDKPIRNDNSYLKKLHIELPKELYQKAINKIMKRKSNESKKHTRIYDEYCCPHCGHCVLVSDIMQNI